MATKIRLQRHGHKDYAFYPIVIADSRAPRDGRFIERIGSYNPNTNPATISLNFERALYWINVGAIPTDTVRNILSREGVKRFEAWKAEKQAKLDAVRNKERDDKKAADKKTIAEEAKKNEAKAEAVAKKKAEIAAAKAAAEAEAAKAAQEAAAAEAPAEEAPAAEAPAEEAAPEA